MHMGVSGCALTVILFILEILGGSGLFDQVGHFPFRIDPPSAGIAPGFFDEATVLPAFDGQRTAP